MNSLQDERFHGDGFYLAAEHDDAAAAAVVAAVGKLETIDAPQRHAARGVARRAKRNAFDGLVEELQPFALAGALPGRNRALARPHAVVPQPGKGRHARED